MAQEERVGRSMRPPFNAFGNQMDEDSMERAQTKGAALALTDAQKLEFGFDPKDEISMMLMGARHPKFGIQVSLATAKDFKMVNKVVPFGNGRAQRIFAVKKFKTNKVT